MRRQRRYDSLTVMLALATGFGVRSTFDYHGWWLVGHVVAAVITGVVFIVRFIRQTRPDEVDEAVAAYRREIQHGMFGGEEH